MFDSVCGTVVKSPAE